jgi:hypothetical protein
MQILTAEGSKQFGGGFNEFRSPNYFNKPFFNSRAEK